MISKNRIKYILSLQKKKVRDEEQQYVIEGDKLIREYLKAGIKLQLLVAKPEFINSLPSDQKAIIEEIENASYDDLKHMSTLKTPHNALAVVRMPDPDINLPEVFKGLSVALDFVQDPGNLGTIIRTAAWFGIRYIFCSENCVDVYNPKVVQASMGAILHVKVHYCDLKKFLSDASKKKAPVYGALLEGESIYSSRPGRKGIILLGNESKGISPDLMPFVTKKLVIPKFTSATIGIESLNVGIAASIVFSEFARKNRLVLTVSDPRPAPVQPDPESPAIGSGG
jgi:RNA methyltransferase, TrmH family